MVEAGAYPVVGVPFHYVIGIFVAPLFAWWALPASLLYTVGLGAYAMSAAVPAWLANVYLSVYWIVIVGLHIAFAKAKKWYLVGILGVILLLSAGGCHRLGQHIRDRLKGDWGMESRSRRSCEAAATTVALFS